MLSYAILSDVFRQISNPQVTCLSNHFAPNSSFGIGCCGIVWRHTVQRHTTSPDANHGTTHHTPPDISNIASGSRARLKGSLFFLSFSFPLNISYSSRSRRDTLPLSREKSMIATSIPNDTSISPRFDPGALEISKSGDAHTRRERHEITTKEPRRNRYRTKGGSKL